MNKQIKQFLVLIFLVVGLLTAIVLVRERQNIRPEAAGATAYLSLLPSQYSFPNTTDTATMQLQATFAGGATGEKLDWFQTEIIFPKDQFMVVEPIRTGSSGFDTIIRVDTPEFANEQGKITIILAAGQPGSGPLIENNASFPVASVVLKALPNAPKAIPVDDPPNISINTQATEIVNNQSEEIPVSQASGAKYTLSIGSGVTLTPPPGTSNFIKVGTIQFKAKAGVTGDARIDFNPDQESFVIEQGGNDILGQITGLILKIISGDGVSPTPDPNAPTISFTVKFRGVSDQSGNNNPNQKVIVRARGDGIYKEYTDIPVTHIGNGIYEATNVNLSGISSLDNILFTIKGPKHLAKNMTYAPPTGIQGAYFDWTGIELEPGDTIPQDGVVNSVDISRIIDLLEVANPSQSQLNVGDLNYDGVVNGADVNELIFTLSSKKDED